CSRHFGNDDYYCGSQKYCAPKQDAGASGGSGGSANHGNGGAAGRAAGGAAGKGGGGGDFADCKNPPNSTCSVADTCAALGCPNLQYDEHGCEREPCKNDDACPATERCGIHMCESPTSCTMEDGMCQCSSLASCGQARRCMPTATAGPRGEWMNLDVTFVR